MIDAIFTPPIPLSSFSPSLSLSYIHTYSLHCHLCKRAKYPAKAVSRYGIHQTQSHCSSTSLPKSSQLRHNILHILRALASMHLRLLSQTRGAKESA